MTEFGAGTHTGLLRDQNEDSHCASPELGLWVVADGIGGYAGGDVASAIVCAAVHNTLASGGNLSNGIEAAHDAVLAEIKTRGDRCNMGSTAVALCLQGDKYEVAWVGDSRAYLWDGALRQLTSDHSKISEMLANNEITADEAAVHPERHILNQCLGVSVDMAPQPGLLQGTLLPGQQILLCSDGLTNELNDAAIAQLLDDKLAAQSNVDMLINAALSAGGRDNITALVIRAPGQENSDSKIVPSVADTAANTPAPRANYSTQIALLLLATTAAVLALWTLI